MFLSTTAPGSTDAKPETPRVSPEHYVGKDASYTAHLSGCIAPDHDCKTLLLTHLVCVCTYWYPKSTSKTEICQFELVVCPVYKQVLWLEVTV